MPVSRTTPHFPIRLFRRNVLKTAIDAYLSAISAAADGSRKAMVERNKLKENIETMMRQLGHWG